MSARILIKLEELLRVGVHELLSLGQLGRLAAVAAQLIQAASQCLLILLAKVVEIDTGHI